MQLCVNTNNNFYSKITYVLHVVDNVTLKNTKKYKKYKKYSQFRGLRIVVTYKLCFPWFASVFVVKESLGLFIYEWMHAHTRLIHTKHQTSSFCFILKFHLESTAQYSSRIRCCSKRIVWLKKWIVSFKKTLKYLFVYVTHNYFPYGSNIIRHSRHNTGEWVKWYLKYEFQSWLHFTPSKPYYTEIYSRTIVNCT